VIRLQDTAWAGFPIIRDSGTIPSILTRRARGSRRGEQGFRQMHARKAGVGGSRKRRLPLFRRSQGLVLSRRDQVHSAHARRTRPERSSNTSSESVREHIDVSRLFLYRRPESHELERGHRRVPQNDDGRARTLRRAAEEHWPYRRGHFRRRADRICYPSLRTIARSVTIVSIRRNGAAALLARIKDESSPRPFRRCSDSPCTARSGMADTGRVPFPVAGERVVGGHAVAAVAMTTG